jgi:hypothetical protein
VWEDFVEFYTFIYSIITLLEHAIAIFSNLLHFLDSWDVYRKENLSMLVVGLKCTLSGSWRLGVNNNDESGW